MKENISLNEVRDWFTKYNKQIPEGPKPDFINATKTTINGQLIVRVPLNRGEGEIFFSKDDTLEVKFFRRVPVSNKSQIKFTGFYESIDMKNYSYYKVNYIEGIKVSVYKSKSIRETPVVENVIRGLNFPEFTGSWFRALLYCVGKYILSIPKRIGNTYGWECKGIGGIGDDSPESSIEQEVFTGSGVYVNLNSLFPLIYPPNTSPTYISEIDWQLFVNGGSNGLDPNIPEIIADPEVLENYYDDPSQFEDDPMLNTFFLMQNFWPAIPSVVSLNHFVRYDYRNCLQLAKEQIGKNGVRDLGYNSAFKIFDSTGGPYPNVAKAGVEYTVSKLQQGIPVIAGVDYKPGSTSTENRDGKTDHFVVIVGMGQEVDGRKYFLFFDNATNWVSNGTNGENKLYFNETTGIITGKTSVTNPTAVYDYRITQIRKNK